jgi:phosphopentomutase
VIVMDSVGIGELPDAAAYGDQGSDTVGNIAKRIPLAVPTLRRLGFDRVAKIGPIPRLVPDAGGTPMGAYGRMAEASAGKDSVTGHWEMMGIVLDRAFPTFPDGFPADIVGEFARRTGRPVIGNKAASGTQIIEELGAEHMRTGALIVYTSADSVFQIAAHEEIVPIDELYRACEIAYALVGEGRGVGRVIARPFVGEPGNYVRTPNRHDFSLEPRKPNYLTLMREKGVKVHGVGKIGDIFAGQDVDESQPTKSNIEGIQVTEKLLQELDDGFVFVNLVETDMLWGHRNDPVNFHRCLQDFDRRLPDLLEALRPGDLLIITSDHGCDPTTPSTDHSREHALLLAYVAGRNAAGQIHEGEFADVGATVNAWLGGKSPSRGIPGAPILTP